MGKNAAETTVFDFDLAQFDVREKSQKGVEVELVIKKDGKELNTNLWLRILGAESDQVLDVVFATQTKRFNEMADNPNKKGKIDARQTHDEIGEQLAASVVSWSKGKDPWTGTVPYNGQMLECTRENVLMLFKSVPDVRILVQNTVENRELFFKG